MMILTTFRCFRDVRLLIFLTIIARKVHTSSCPLSDNGYRCSGHGSCTTKGQCQCGEGYDGADCSRKQCKKGVAWEYDGLNSYECSNRGLCVEGRCVCHPSYQGAACEYLACHNGCTGRGRCVNLRNYIVEAGFETMYTPWDSELINGCVCDTHPSGYDYMGYDCSLVSCPRGDDPMTTGQVNEKQLVKCTGSAGSFQLRYPSSQGHGITIQHTDDVLTVKQQIEKLGRKVTVTFSAGTTACNAVTENVITIEYTDDFGKQVPFLTDFTGITAPEGAEVKVAYGGTPLGIVASVEGSKENTMCSGRGLCDAVAGDCYCYLVPMPGYRSSDGYGNPGARGDCGAADDHKFHGNTAPGPIGCPGELACSGHGVCQGSPTYKCLCSDGWTSGDCSERTCPTAWPWFPVDFFNIKEESQLSKLQQPEHQECSNRGICDRTKGECSCQPGFTGAACQQMSFCTTKSENPCNDHGRCLSMYQIATNAGMSSAQMAFHEPWIHKRYGTSLFACECDAGWTGYDCSLKQCPFGDYPLFPGEKEQQLLYCVANNGTFQLSYGEEQTATLAWDSTISELEKGLEAMQAITDVQVEYTLQQNGDRLCSNDTSLANVVKVTFEDKFYTLLKPVGQADVVLSYIPDLQVISSTNYISFVESTDTTTGVVTYGNSTLAVATDGTSVLSNTYSSVNGTRQHLECSGRGTCNYDTGICNCFTGFSSSDGQGKRGQKGDCGFIEKYQNVQ